MGQGKWVPYIQIIIACLIWGSYGLFVQLIPYPPEVIVFFRFLFGAICLIIMASLTGNLHNLKPTSGWKMMVIISAINSISWLTLTRSITYTSVANGFILYYTAPCFVVLLAPFLLKEKVEKKSIIALLFCFIGVVAITGQGETITGNHKMLGNILGLISGITYAIYVIGLKSIPEKFLGIVSNVYLCIVISVITFPMALPAMGSISLKGILILVLLGITIQGIATTLYMVGLRKVKAQHASILSFLEFLFASLFAALFLNEQFTFSLILGSILIIIGGIIVVIKKSESKDGFGTLEENNIRDNTSI
ncbi:EamA domain-containing membrane protein RarD [Desulfonispora thiosulfatigenes DSM 11270]|uniref:EamA domain-containing membrane protein RarD n=1 Tax=Desulfonispora thiosulfatigenes DSM 11270 TaxID=656914 RepID=A0A1W1VG68_DESTI|nr:DMT family transporter [Desulfonispora thiosulfatigenes]SMB92326.1 EamA domain-containing membrane protein RarD [Desulfonispora thiosulfatigenes DSM 11270]